MMDRQREERKVDSTGTISRVEVPKQGEEDHPWGQNQAHSPADTEGVSPNKEKGGAGWGVTEAGSLLVGQGSGLVFVAS